MLSILVVEIGRCLCVPAYHAADNLFKLQSNRNDLEKKMETLANLRENVCDQISNLRRQGNVPTPQVEEWIKEVDKIMLAAHRMEPDMTADNRRLSGCFSVCGISRKTADTLREIERLSDACPLSINCKVTKVEHISEPSVDQTTASRTLAKIMGLLSCDEIRRIGIWGVAGVGKTTLLKYLYNNLVSLESMKPFGMAIWVTVSKECNILRVQTQIAERLKMEVGGSTERMAIRLYQRLQKEEKFLLILDDVWETIDLVSLGIPEPEVHMGCKILFASRSQSVCRMMNADREVEVDIMNFEEAWQLFSEYCGEVASLEQIKPLAAQVVKECSGLPLAITVMGASMRGKESIQVWEDTLVTLQSSMSLPCFKGIEERALKWSYASLQVREKHHSFEIVMCPKCRQLLPEFSNAAIYQCGQCNIFLQAKGPFKSLSDITEPSKEEAFGGSSGTTSSIMEEKLGTPHFLTQTLREKHDPFQQQGKCPKCRHLLPELSDVATYRCVGCGAVLQGKGTFKGLSDITEPSKEEAFEGSSGTKSSKKKEKLGTSQPIPQTSHEKQYPFQRLVKCPKCHQLLPELSDVATYRCGGCGAVLQGKGIKFSDIEPYKKETFGGSSGTKSSEKEEKLGTFQPIPQAYEAKSNNPSEEFLRTDSSHTTESVEAWTKSTASTSETDTSSLVYVRKAASRRQLSEITEMHEQTHSHSSLDRADVPVDMSLESVVQNGIINLSVGGDMKNDQTLKRILDYITNSDVGKIGIYGRAGVGKTTVMEIVVHKRVIRDVFDCVIWVAVPEVWNVMQVQMEIIKQISYNTGTDDVHNNMVRLTRLLKHLKFLLILDNVREQINLEMVGIPEPTPENGSKIVLTTRSEQVCHIMAVSLKIQLEDLLSWELFCEKAGEVANFLNIQPIARKIVEMCGHYSLAIILMARTLKDVFDTALWNHALERLRIQHPSDKVNLEILMVGVLKFCWERLEDDMIRNCLRNVAMYSKEQEVDGNALIELWISNGLIGTYQKGKKTLQNLIDANLLESDKSGLFVKMQDVVRHVLVNLIIQPKECRLFLMRSGLELTEPPKDEEWETAKEIYLQQNELSMLPENPRCSILSALFLQRNPKLRIIPLSFFEDMPALQVLNLSRTGIKSLPESLFRLASLRRLYLTYCDRLMVLSPNIGDLKHLEVLDLEGTEIMDLPKEVKKLTTLKCLEVSFYRHMNDGSRKPKPAKPVIPGGIISSLIQLEELSINVDPDDERWNLCVEAIVNEFFSLPRLSTLKFYFPRVEFLRHFKWYGSILYPSLSNFSITVGHHVNRIMNRIPNEVEFELERWDKCLKYVNGVDVLSDVTRLLRYATSFYLDRHSNVKKLSDFGAENMEELKCCVLAECNELQVIIDGEEVQEEEIHRNEIVSESDNKRIVLGSLEYFYIYYMKNLKSIWEGSVQKCFLLLKCLSLHTCPQLTTIFSPDLLDNFCNLEELVVQDCPAILSIVSCNEPAKYQTSYFLPRLKKISLHYMPELVSISSGLRVAPKLEWVSVYDCPKLKSLSREEMSSKDLRKIKGEWSWWEALEWKSGWPNHLNGIFVPIDE